jgi:hypothetical protein
LKPKLRLLVTDNQPAVLILFVLLLYDQWMASTNHGLGLFTDWHDITVLESERKSTVIW